MSSTPYDSNLEDEDAEQFVTTEEGSAGRHDSLPLDLDDGDGGSLMEQRSPEDTEGHESEDLDDDDDGGTNEKSEDIEFLKPPGMTIDDFLDEDEKEKVELHHIPIPIAVIPEPEEIDILKLGQLTPEEAAKIAEGVIGVLEEDIAAYMAKTGIKFPEPLTQTELKRLKLGLREGDSSSSFNSETSDILPGEPSKVRMTYERGVSVFPHLSLIHLSANEMVDEEIQVSLHRPKKSTAPKVDGFSQTLEMTFHPGDIAMIIFTSMYPQYSEEIKAQEPPSRQASQELAIKLAVEADPDVDNEPKRPTVMSISNKKQLLQPLKDNYHKDDTLWTGCRFTGEYVSRQFFKGKYLHPTGATMESEFLNGHFHTNNHLGCVSYPRGDTFEGKWEEGRYQNGTITFNDGLIFANTNWKFLEPPDRRFKIEKFHGMRPAGRTLFSDQNPPPYVPPGNYDVGDGYYNPKNGEVRRYDGLLQRKASETEANWIRQNCRKVYGSIEHSAPKFVPERIPGSYCETQKRIPLMRKRFH